MKILFINLLFNVAFGIEAPATADYSWVIEELNASTEMVMVETIPSKVKVFDASGNLVTEFCKSENLNKNERGILAKSALMYEYLGDSYYLLDK
jgi:hypothetical protein